MAHPTPRSVTGGCLCSSIRYEINFSPDHDFKESSMTCQCTQCRRTSGALIYNLHTVAASEITWLAKSTYAEYKSSPNCYRGFCSRCGSSLTWREGDDRLDIAVGTIDEELLVGERGEDDRPVEGTGFGRALGGLEGKHVWVRNEIEGVTDWVSKGGKRLWEGS